jgi:hypothetical protein
MITQLSRSYLTGRRFEDDLDSCTLARLRRRASGRRPRISKQHVRPAHRAITDQHMNEVLSLEGPSSEAFDRAARTWRHYATH